MANLPSFAADVTDAVDMHAYGELQRRLRAMQYDDPVGVDSVALVKRLLADVVSATEKREELTRELEHAQREAIELSQIILPLRRENAKLLRENNSKRSANASERCELEVERLRDEISQLQFVSSQRAKDVAEKEKGWTSARTVGAYDGRWRPARKQLQSSIEMRRSETAALSTSPRWQDAQRLQARLEHREKEIARLSQLTVERAQPRPTDDETTQLQIEQLTTQIDILNDQVAKYETRLKSANEQLRRQSAMDHKLRSKAQTMRTVALLRERVSSLEAENAKLEEALRATHYDKVSFTNALANANSHNKVLSSDLARAEAKASEAAESRHESQLALAEARAETEARTRELDVLRESLRQD
ncbi:hypothetical protein PINS_up020173 [Pythium insidiosum]|nr:hypothetical protein PINS_up020173 [Pythium insidiosum]